jgi:hypothetical protein
MWDSIYFLWFFNPRVNIAFRNFGPGPPISPVPEVVLQAVRGHDVPCKVDSGTANDGTLRCILTIGPSAWTGKLPN